MAVFALSYDEALRYLQTQAPLVLKEVQAIGMCHVDVMLRHVDCDTMKRIYSGDLTEEERQQKDGFYLTRHAAYVIASHQKARVA